MALKRLRSFLLSTPWPVTFGLLVPLQLLLAWTQYKGLSMGVLSRGVMELWVHGRQPTLAWVPFIHPPGYSLFMNVVDTTSAALDVDPAAHVLVHGWLCHAAVVVLVAWAMNRWLDARAALVAAALVALSPNGLRPFEHYPLATLLSTGALLACVELARRGDKRSMWIAIVAVWIATDLHLSTWFAIGGTMALVFATMAERRKVAFVASAAMIGGFLLTTIPGLWRVLAMGAGDDPERTVGTMTVEWTNPALLALLVVWFVPWLFKRAPEAAALACGIAAFSAVTLELQRMQVADGQPYPYSLHYFELVDPALAVCAAWALHLGATGGAPGRRRGGGAALAARGLIASQGWFLLQGQGWVFLNKFWFWAILWPFGG